MKTEKNKYFIALIPPDPLQSEIGEIKQLFHTDYGSKGALRSPAHITLHMPFLWKQKKEDKLIDLLVRATKETSFDLILNGFGCFVPRTVAKPKSDNFAPYLQSMMFAGLRSR